MRKEAVVTSCAMDEKVVPTLPSKSTKNNDCYFYYYSSCSKGDACPFRHEPAALRNETVCIFWLQGNCNKKNCIFRHMELTKQRDKIACWFETQPGGCKKPHCPFQHQNILDHPREEDIKKKPDLILPVKKDEAPKSEADTGDSEEFDRHVDPTKNGSGGATPPRQAYFSAASRDPIIVSLQDGESDSESVSGSPCKRGNPELSAQLEWELQRLRQIQAHEADIIGYVFADDDEDDVEEEERFEEEPVVQNQHMEEYVVEEVVEVEEEPDAIHRRLRSPQRSSLLSVHPRSQLDSDFNDHRRGVLNSQVNAPKDRKKVQISERLGGVASRAFAETLGADVQLRRPFAGRLSDRNNELTNVSYAKSKRSPTNSLTEGTMVQIAPSNRSLAERLERSPNKKLSLLERLGTKDRKEPSLSRLPRSSDEEVSMDNSIANRIMAIRNTCMEDVGKDSRTSDLGDSMSSGNVSKPKDSGLDFSIKSLADIRAEKQKKGGPMRQAQPNNTGKGLQSRLGLQHGRENVANKKTVESTSEVDGLKIMSLSEIKSKQKNFGNKSNVSQQRQKRSISPISFGGAKQKPASNSGGVGVQNKKRSISPISFAAESKPKSSRVIDTSVAQNKKRSISLISFDDDNQGSKKVCSSLPGHDSVQTIKPKTPKIGVRKVTIVKAPIKSLANSEPVVKEKTKETVIRGVVNTKVSVKSMDNKNNNISVENTKGAAILSRQPPLSELNDSKRNSSNKSLTQLESSLLLDEEEELLLGGDMADDEDDDIDEAALLL